MKSMIQKDKKIIDTIIICHQLCCMLLNFGFLYGKQCDHDQTDLSVHILYKYGRTQEMVSIAFEVSQS